MDYRNQTEKIITEHLRDSVRVWKNLKKQLPLRITLKKNSKTAYSIFNNSNHTGAFIPCELVKEDEMKELGWEIVREQ